MGFYAANFWLPNSGYDIFLELPMVFVCVVKLVIYNHSIRQYV